jgi:hypothetical protein
MPAGVIFKYAETGGEAMRFSDEDEIEQWYAGEKEKLDTAFAAAILGKEEKIASEKAKYEAKLKALIEAKPSATPELKNKAGHSPGS